MINPRAYLASLKNVKRGLEARSLILEKVSGRELSVDEICKMTGLSRGRVIYHLRNMLSENIVRKRRVGRRVMWKATGSGQASLDEAR